MDNIHDFINMIRRAVISNALGETNIDLIELLNVLEGKISLAEYRSLQINYRR